jgi:type II secretory pathway component PulM
MTMFNRIIRFVKQLDVRETYQFIGGLVALISLVVGLFFYRYYSLINGLQRQMVRINQQRVVTQELLSRYDEVVQQQHHVEELLKRDPNFKLKQFFIDTLQKLSLANSLVRDPEVASQALVTDYIEIKMDVRLTAITMQQLVELLHAVEQSERVYIKEMKITAVPQKQMLDVTLVVATFEEASATV